MFEPACFFANTASARRPWWTFPAAAALHGMVVALALAASLAAVSAVDDPDIFWADFFLVDKPPLPPPPAAGRTSTRRAAPAPRIEPLSQPESVELLTKQDLEAQGSIDDEKSTGSAAGEGDEGQPDGVPGGLGSSIGGGWSGILGDPLSPERAAPIEVGADVVAPRLLRRVDPEYPDAARRARIAGVVELRAVISESGDVEVVSVLRGHPALAPAALEAVQQWKYSPALLDGRPVRVRFLVIVRFQLV